MKYVAYIRVSTAKQELGLEAQKYIIDHYAQLDKAEVITIFSESESGKDIENRPELKKAIDLCIKHDYILVVAKLDRLSRDVEHIFRLKKLLGDKLKSCDLPSTDSLTLSIFSGIAQRERELISLRTKQALEVKKKQGIKLGKPDNFNNAGRRKGSETTRSKAIQNENTIRARAFALSQQEQGKSLAVIATALNSNGFRSSKGNIFYSETVRRLILN